MIGIQILGGEVTLLLEHEAGLSAHYLQFFAIILRNLLLDDMVC